MASSPTERRIKRSEIPAASRSVGDKPEWDVVAGVALVRAAGGQVEVLDDPQRGFNQRVPLMPGLLAYGRTLRASIQEVIARTADAG